MEKVKIALITGSIFLLIIIVLLISKLKKTPESPFSIKKFNKNQNKTLDFKKTDSEKTKTQEGLYEESLNKRQGKEKSEKEEKTLVKENIYKKTKIFNRQTAKKLDDFTKKLPIETDSFIATYSSEINKIVVLEKNNEAKKDFEKILKQNDLSKKEINPIIVETKNPQEAEEILKAKDIVINKHIEDLLKPKPTPTPYKFESYQEYKKDQEKKFLKSLENTIRDLFAILKTPAEEFRSIEEIENNNVPSQNPSPPQAETISQRKNKLPSLNRIPETLKEIVKKVSQDVGVPEGIIMAVITIENPAVFNLPESKIKEYSKPGNTWPSCKPNVCSAAGPMQITTGIDSFGSPACSQCCWKGRCLDARGGCPNQWARYGHAVNTYGGSSHTPNPCNIKDNIYAGALKLKTDSKATSPISWTKEQVFKAAKSYYGDCSVRYERLGNRTYCEFVWDYYLNSIK